MTLFADATGLLFDTLSTLNGESVTYTRSSDTGTLTMWRGTTEFDSYDADEHEFSGKTVDWMIAAAKLKLTAAGVTLPEIGDTITDADSQVYRVIQPSGERHYRYTDQSEKGLRIHTIRIT